MACSSAADDEQIRKMSEAFKNGSERERIQICIDAIDKKIICQGCSVEGMDRIFSTNFKVPDESTKGFDSLYSGVVHFRDDDTHPVSVEGNAASALPARKGWYLAFKYKKNGSIYDYYLSNTGK